MEAKEVFDVLTRAAQVRAQLTHDAAPFALENGVSPLGYNTMRYKNAPALLTDWLNMGRAHGDKPFLAYYRAAPGQDLPKEGQNWSFSAFYAAVDSVTSYLQHPLELPAGARVAIYAANSPQWLIAFAASSYAGGVVAPLNSMNGGRDALETLIELQPALLACDSVRYEQLQQAYTQWPELAAQLPAFPMVLLDGEQSPCPTEAAVFLSQHPLHFLPAALQTPPAQVAHRPVRSSNDEALIIYTSGASKRPKGAIFTHDAVCQALYNLEFIGAFAALGSPSIMQRMLSSGYAPCLLNCVPLFHVSGLYAQVLGALKNGRKIVLLPRWNPQHALELLHRESVTSFTAAPSMVMQLMRDARFGDPNYTPALMALGFGGSAMQQSLRDELAQRFAGCMSGTGFGLTESGGAGIGASGDIFALRPEAAGLLSPIMELSVQDDAGLHLPIAGAGELCLRGPTLMKGYWARPEESAEALRGNWLHTGDWGYVDADGYCHVVDRIKDIINRHGEKIAASEIESCLTQHPAVREAAVVPLPDPVTQEQVAALVVLLPGMQVDACTLIDWLRPYLPTYKIPQTLCITAGPLPRNAMGKVVKAQVVELLLSQI